ncbi:MAG TPA: hypothetical protein VHZ29_05535 [Rhizomicrobium sp.]|jgi:hypothetical protein|nr:hypothetical protein [Rhizomicrobium sp.]
MLLTLTVVGDENKDGFSDDVLCGVAEQPFGRVVPALDGAVEALLTMASFDDSTIAASC